MIQNSTMASGVNHSAKHGTGLRIKDVQIVSPLTCTLLTSHCLGTKLLQVSVCITVCHIKNRGSYVSGYFI